MASEKKTVLHLVGSSVSEYYEGVSSYYASECFQAVTETGTYEHRIARVHCDGTWSFPKDYSEEEKAAPRVDIIQALQTIKDLTPSVMIPHMFCLPGMTTFRTLFEALKIPMVGCDGPLMSLSTNKAHSRVIVESAGVPVAKGELLHKGDKPTLQPPFVLKPCSEDNSMGITLFTGKNGQDLDEALETAFTFDDEVLCEKFVPLGREIRVGVLELDDGSLEMLPCIEYILDPEQPIRSSADKLSTDSRGVATKPNPATRRQCPADIDPTLRGKLEQLAMRSHRALGCRDYSLYDVRVDPEGEPYFLEACLYCSFAPKSVIVLMAGAKGTSQQEVFEMLVERSVARHEQRKNSGQILGMKAK